MRKFLRYLRIAFTAVCGIMVVLLVVLWVRSYSSWYDLDVSGMNSSVTAMKGKLFINEMFYPKETDTRTTVLLKDHLLGYPIRITVFRGGDFTPFGTGITIPIWCLILLSAALSFVPGLHQFSWHFTLRTLLLATTLIAAVLGFLVWMVR